MPTQKVLWKLYFLRENIPRTIQSLTHHLPQHFAILNPPENSPWKISYFLPAFFLVFLRSQPHCEIVHSEWFPSFWRQCAADGAPWWGIHNRRSAPVRDLTHCRPRFNPQVPPPQPHFILLPPLPLPLRCWLLLNFSPKLANRQFWS